MVWGNEGITSLEIVVFIVENVVFVVRGEIVVGINVVVINLVTVVSGNKGIIVSWIVDFNVVFVDMSKSSPLLNVEKSTDMEVFVTFVIDDVV